MQCLDVRCELRQYQTWENYWNKTRWRFSVQLNHCQHSRKSKVTLQTTAIWCHCYVKISATFLNSGNNGFRKHKGLHPGYSAVHVTTEVHYKTSNLLFGEQDWLRHRTKEWHKWERELYNSCQLNYRIEYESGISLNTLVYIAYFIDFNTKEMWGSHVSLDNRLKDGGEVDSLTCRLPFNPQ
jgi:hypothetical protein